MIPENKLLFIFIELNKKEEIIIRLKIQIL